MRVGDDTAAGDAEDAEGYRFGPTRFSVVPRSATGHVSIRFVPDQDANRLFELFRSVACSSADILAPMLGPFCLCKLH